MTIEDLVKRHVWLIFKYKMFRSTMNHYTTWEKLDELYDVELDKLNREYCNPLNYC